MRRLRAARPRPPSLARVALQVLVALSPAAAHADASVPGKTPGKGQGKPPKPEKARPVGVEPPSFSGGVIAQPTFVAPPPPPPPPPVSPKKKEGSQ